MRQVSQQPYTSCPVLIPEHWGSRGKEATRRRRRRSPILAVLTIAALAVLPFVAYVAAVSNAAHIGYRILQLTQDIAVLESEHERLQATASSLGAPGRIEHLATTRLGLHAPRVGQIAALPLSPIASHHGPTKLPGLWERLGAYFHRSEAAAAEPPR
jgi:cell division protein FtsL